MGANDRVASISWEVGRYFFPLRAEKNSRRCSYQAGFWCICSLQLLSYEVGYRDGRFIWNPLVVNTTTAPVNSIPDAIS